MPSTSTLVNSHTQPSRAGDTWNVLQISTSTKPAERRVKRTSEKFEPERRNRSERSDERTLRRHAVDRQKRHENFEVENVDNSSVAKEAWSVTHEKNGRKTGKRRKAGLKPACCVIGWKKTCMHRRSFSFTMSIFYYIILFYFCLLKETFINSNTILSDFGTHIDRMESVLLSIQWFTWVQRRVHDGHTVYSFAGSPALPKLPFTDPFNEFHQERIAISVRAGSHLPKTSVVEHSFLHHDIVRRPSVSSVGCVRRLLCHV